MVTVGVRGLSFDEWLALPETMLRYEVLDGVLMMAPAPMGEHQWLDMEIATRLKVFVTRAGLGIVIPAPYDVLIRREPLKVRQPDIMVVNAALTGISSPADLVGRRFLELPPLLVVEILSPSNNRREVEERLADYRSIGVPECWLVNFPGRLVEVVRLSRDGAVVVGVYGMGDVLRSEVLPGFELAVADIFGPLLG